jgi:sialic acid synthase SpsE
VKFQTFKAERLVTQAARKADYQVRATGGDETQFEMLRRLELSADAHREILRHCERQGILFLSSPFDEESADFLDALGVPAFKLGSGELTNLPLIAHVARKSRPVILSTGMATLAEVADAVQVATTSGTGGVLLLQCVSNYPAQPADVNLRAMTTMADAFKVPVGYSDHTLGNHVSVAAVALGACIIEKHFTLDCQLPGPDHQASIEPPALAALVREIRDVEAALGDGRKVPAASEAATARAARRSLVAAVDIAAGVALTDAHLELRRPGTGLSPAERAKVVGRTARAAIAQGTVIQLDMLQ